MQGQVIAVQIQIRRANEIDIWNWVMHKGSICVGNRKLRRIFLSTRKLRSEELHNFYSSHVMRMIKSRSIMW
jgi:hypothetical protein